MRIEHHTKVNMYHVSAQGVDERNDKCTLLLSITAADANNARDSTETDLGASSLIVTATVVTIPTRPRLKRGHTGPCAHVAVKELQGTALRCGDTPILARVQGLTRVPVDVVVRNAPTRILQQ